MMKKVIYLDNSATNRYKPRRVLKSLLSYTKKQANAGHGGNSQSIHLSQKIWQVREKVATHYGLDKTENVIFTKNCTEALNMVIHGLHFNKKNNVVVSTFEHNSVLRPLYNLQERGKISLTVVTPSNKKYITSKDVENCITDNTALVCICSYSNVTGNRNDIENIGKLCAQHDILFLVDDAQGAGHERINMIESNINFLAFSGHKGFFSPQGVGALCINYTKSLSPIIQGGTGTDSHSLSQPSHLPESLESGTLMAPIITSLGEGIDFVEKNQSKINKRISLLSNYLTKRLSEINIIKIFSTHTIKSGVITFEVEGIDSVRVSTYFDEKCGIITRSGLHCAPLAHKFLNTTKSGLVRISVNHKNTLKEMKYTIKSIKKCINYYKKA